MIHLSSGFFRKAFYTYVTTIVLLLVLPLHGTFRLTQVYFGFRSDHLVHCFIFLPFMTLCYMGNISSITKKLLLYGYSFATFCEFLHVFIPYRQASIFDLFANYLGITLSFLFLKFAKRIGLLPIV